MTKYGKTELERHAAEMHKCREIVKEIMDFGVSQKQILQTIYLLSLELENSSHLSKISSLVKNLQEEGIVSI